MIYAGLADRTVLIDLMNKSVSNRDPVRQSGVILCTAVLICTARDGKEQARKDQNDHSDQNNSLPHNNLINGIGRTSASLFTL